MFAHMHTRTPEFNQLATDVIINLFKKIELIKSINNLKQKEITILSPACGVGLEANALDAYFKQYNKSIQYIGVDVDKNVIEGNKEQFVNQPHFHFIHANAKSPCSISLTKHSVDLVFFGHPDPLLRPDTFFKIMHLFIPYFLKPQGTLFLSTYCYEELKVLMSHEITKKLFQFETFPVFEADPLKISIDQECYPLYQFFGCGKANIQQKLLKQLLAQNTGSTTAPKNNYSFFGNVWKKTKLPNKIPEELNQLLKIRNH